MNIENTSAFESSKPARPMGPPYDPQIAHHQAAQVRQTEHQAENQPENLEAWWQRYALQNSLAVSPQHEPQLIKYFGSFTQAGFDLEALEDQNPQTLLNLVQVKLRRLGLDENSNQQPLELFMLELQAVDSRLMIVGSNSNSQNIFQLMDEQFEAVVHHYPELSTPQQQLVQQIAGQHPAGKKLLAALPDKNSNLDSGLDQARLAEITPWIAENLPDCQPHELAAQGCLKMEREAQELDETYQITSEQPENIRPDVELFLTENGNETEVDQKLVKIAEKKETITTNKTEAAALQSQEVEKDRTIDDGEQEIATTDAKIVAERTKTPKLQKAAEKEHSAEATKNADFQIIKANYPEPLKSEHGGNIGALNALKGLVRSPEMKVRLDKVIGMISTLQNTVPGKSEVVTKLLNSAHLNLGSASMIGVFSDFITHVDNSSEFTDEEKSKIHKVLHSSRHVTGSAEAKDALKQGRGTVTDPETGETKTLSYDENHKLEGKGGVFFHSGPNGEIIISTKNGWSETLPPGTTLSELRLRSHFAGPRSTYLQNGFEHYLGYDFKLHPPRPYQKKFEQITNALLGGSRGLDATFYSEGELHKLIHINKFISHFGETPIKANESVMNQSLKALGADPKSPLEVNLAVYKEIGSFFQETPSAHGEESFEQLRKRLAEKGLISGDETGGNDDE